MTEKSSADLIEELVEILDEKSKTVHQLITLEGQIGALENSYGDVFKNWDKYFPRNKNNFREARGRKRKIRETGVLFSQFSIKNMASLSGSVPNTEEPNNDLNGNQSKKIKVGSTGDNAESPLFKKDSAMTSV